MAMEFDHYDVVPPQIANEIKKERGVKDVEEEA
jgi:hypothetical protein